MTAASPPNLSLNVANNDHKRGSIRRGSIFNLFNIASNERLIETTDVDIQLFDGTKMCALIDVIVYDIFLFREINSCQHLCAKILIDCLPYLDNLLMD